MSSKKSKSTAGPKGSSAKKPTGKAKKEAGQPKKVSALDAAAKVLAGAKEPMTAKQLIGAMATRGLWSSPAGKTPEATLYAAIIREIAAKGASARFTKTDRGLFAATAGREGGAA